MSDTISRQAAIDAVCMEWCGVKHQDCKHPFDVEKDDYYWCDGCETALRTLPDLPSAEPESRRKWYMKGYRDAQDAALHESCTDCPLYDHDRHRCPRFNKVIPTTIQEIMDTQTQRGKWVKISPANIYECSQCGKNVMTDDISEYDFCHGCGADMRGEQDG